MRRRNNNLHGDLLKKTIAINAARHILKDISKEVKKSAKRNSAPPPPTVNMYGSPSYPRNNYTQNSKSGYQYSPGPKVDLGAPPPPSHVDVRANMGTKKRKTKANTDGAIAIIIICIFIFANVIINMTDLVIGGLFNLALIAALIVALVFLFKFISKKIKEHKEKREIEEAEKAKIKEEERIKKEAEEKKKQEEEEERKRNLTGNEELDKIILEGNDYIKKLREANVAIEHEGISESIDRMEKAAADIFAFVKDNPSQIPEIKKFMNYYLPTTLKLLNSYEKLSRQSVKGENIQSAMFDIEGMMQTIATAFEKQLDFLFGTEILDLQADITVMENILEQEGLKESDSAPKLKL